MFTHLWGIKVSGEHQQSPLVLGAIPRTQATKPEALAMFKYKAGIPTRKLANNLCEEWKPHSKGLSFIHGDNSAT